MVKWTQNFFRKILRSCYDVAWYREVRGGTTGAAFRYATLLHLLMAVVAALIFIPGLFRIRSELVFFLQNEVPDASITVTDGQLSTNVETPFVREVDGLDIVLDPAVEGTTFPERLSEDDPGLLLGRDAAFMQVPGESERIVPYSTSFNWTITSREAVAELTKANGHLVFTGAMFALLYGTVVFIGNILFALSAALLLRMLGRAWNAPLPYVAWLRVALFALTLPLFVDTLTLLFGLPLPFVFTGLFVLIAAAVFIDERNQPTPLSAPPKVPPAPAAPKEKNE